MATNELTYGTLAIKMPITSSSNNYSRNHLVAIHRVQNITRGEAELEIVEFFEKNSRIYRNQCIATWTYVEHLV